MSRLTRLEQYRMIQDASGNWQKELQLTTYERTKKGEVISVTSPLSDVVKYNYDKLGRVTSQTDEEGLATLYEYNLAGSLAKITYADGKTVAFSYDPLRRLTEIPKSVSFYLNIMQGHKVGVILHYSTIMLY